MDRKFCSHESIVILPWKFRQRRREPLPVIRPEAEVLAGWKWNQRYHAVLRPEMRVNGFVSHSRLEPCPEATDENTKASTEGA
ncbi:hypothetical protein PC116_g13051 [Phytophthora cactorum]|nr:hypothetical protein PC114_g10457 [Phytophthora cactorum]KAG4063502.1 hypothetical protein PC123_g1612 [Phytophthora cactorum]KAG4238940.1 hypothetical protein PC116_g13051 [Phytophthora cactorum]